MTGDGAPVRPAASPGVLEEGVLEEEEPLWPGMPRVDRRTALAAVRLLREADWWRALLGVVLLSVVFVLLGRWQWHRHEYKLERNHRVNANYAAPAVPIAAVLPGPSAPFPAAREWRPVQVRGSYRAQDTVLVRNRPLNGEDGYEVLVPLRTAAGAVLLVDRGWVPAGATAQRPDAVPAPPSGPVDVVVRLRPPEPAAGRRAPPGQALSIDVAQIARRLRLEPVYAGYGVLAAESPRPPGAPTLLPRPSVDLGPHLGYAIQWWAFAITAYVLLASFAVREAQRRLEKDPVGPADRR